MAKELTREEMHKALFTNLVMMLGSSAMQQLGKLVNPMTNKTEVSLEGAQVTIDMIEMLKVRTKGNLDKDEDTLITDLLSSLQMNYVETAKSAPAEDKGGEKKPEEGGKADAADEEDSGNDDGKEKKDPKFHKSYGE